MNRRRTLVVNERQFLVAVVNHQLLFDGDAGDLINLKGRAADYSPMPAATIREAFNDPDWLFEPKWDGFRALAYIEHGECRLVSRKGYAYKLGRDWQRNYQRRCAVGLRCSMTSCVASAVNVLEHRCVRTPHLETGNRSEMAHMKRGTRGLLNSQHVSTSVIGGTLSRQCDSYGSKSITALA